MDFLSAGKETSIHKWATYT